MNVIVSVDPKQFGLEESKAEQIAGQFAPMLAKMVELEAEFNEVINLPIEDKATTVRAKELRLKYVNVRTGTAEIHKEQKAFYLAGGRFVDGWKNAQIFASEGIEKKLEGIEKHAEINERERIEAIRNERIALLAPFNIPTVETLGLGGMSEEIWQNFYTGCNNAHEQKVLAEAKEREERLERERQQLEERKRIQEENERLRKEAEQKDKELAEERRRIKEKEEQEEKRLSIERKANEARARIAEEEKQAELSKGDAEKMKDLIYDLSELVTKYSFQSKKYQAVYSQVAELLGKVITHINTKLK